MRIFFVKDSDRELIDLFYHLVIIASSFVNTFLEIVNLSYNFPACWKSCCTIGGLKFFL